MTRATELRRKSSLALHWWAVDYLVASALQRDLARHLPHLTGRVLDLGCGNSPYRSHLTGMTQYLGCDIDTTSDAAVVSVAEALAFAAETFDGVLCTQVIEHVPEPWRVVEEIARVLRPGGRLLLSAPQAWRLHEKPHDYYRFTRYGLAHLLTRAGLRALTCEAQGGVWRLVGQTVNNWLWERRHPRGSLHWGLSRVLSVALGTPVNLLCAALDAAFYDPDDTLNLVVWGEKPNA
ncbi:MAG: class I SAM-dependent methyltransferase [Anaerolineales bacterium]